MKQSSWCYKPIRRHRGAVSVFVPVLLASCLLAAFLCAGSAFAQTTYPERLGGDTRYDTMQLVSEKGWADGSCHTVVVVSGENFPDALTADALAGFYGCPVLTTQRASLSSQCASEIVRLGARRVVILGGPAAVSSVAESSIKALASSIKVTRIYGLDRVGTSLSVLKSKNDWGTTAILCKGTMFPGALSISSYAYAAHTPVLLANNSGSLTGSERKALVDGGFKRVIITGGGFADSDEEWMKTVGITPVRLAGEDRYETCAKIAAFATGTGAYTSEPAVLSYESVGITRGDNFPDGLSGGALLGKERGVLLLINGGDASGGYSVDSTLRSQEGGVSGITVFGGPAAITEVAADMSMIRAGLWHPAALQFISDVQLEDADTVYSRNFEAALQSIRAIEPSTSGVVIVGDAVQDASESEYAHLSKLITQAGLSPTEDMTYAAGNHELNTSSSKESLDVLRARFVSEFGLSGCYYSKYVGGLHIIALCSDSNVSRWTWARFSKAQLAWLDKQLAADKAAGIVSYVLCHQPYAGTVDGSQSWTGSGDCIENLAELKAVTDKYPNAIIFSGHSHFPIDIERPVATGPLYVGTGTMAYEHDSVHTPRCQGWFVYALDDRVVFLGRDFLSSRWANSYIYYR